MSFKGANICTGYKEHCNLEIIFNLGTFHLEISMGILQLNNFLNSECTQPYMLKCCFSYQMSQIGTMFRHHQRLDGLLSLYPNGILHIAVRRSLPSFYMDEPTN